MQETLSAPKVKGNIREMDWNLPSYLADSLRAQAALRLKVGVPLTVVMLLAYFLWPPVSTAASSREVLGMASLYVFYIVAAVFICRRPRTGALPSIVAATAILDPMMLSGWLYVVGELSIAFVGFYIFTILGFGFRMGIRTMQLCQVASLVGFSTVALISPTWDLQPMFSFSHLVLLLVVPSYASVLIKQLHAAKALAERESRAKTHLLANVSHELRTPLTGIVASAELLERESREAGTKKRAHSILHLARSLDVEVKQLLDLAKLESTNVSTPVATPLDLHEAVEQVMQALRPVAHVKGIALLADVDPAITALVMGQPNELHSVLMNLSGNALKFTPAGSVTIKIRLLEDADDSYRVWFGVRDTGIGISTDHQAHIFDPFYQVETGLRRKYGGTGLGTTIASKHVEQMGGSLRVESELIKGSLFSFELTLPHALEQRLEDLTQAPIPELGNAFVTGKRVLIADDHLVNLELMREMLAKDGHTVTTATSGEDAVRILSDCEFDVLFLDYNMSDMDGAAVYEAYRFFRFDNAPTFFVTADTTALAATKLEALDIAGVIHKPITFEKLRRAITSQFPTEVREEEAAVRPILEEMPRLRAVPIEFIDPAAIEMLREVNDTPEFLHKMLRQAAADIETMQPLLGAAIRNRDISAVHRHAHGMRGVAMTVGAVRLSALDERLMTISADGLRQWSTQTMRDLDDVTQASLAALRTLQHDFSPQKSKNLSA